MKKTFNLVLGEIIGNNLPPYVLCDLEELIKELNEHNITIESTVPGWGIIMEQKTLSGYTAYTLKGKVLEIYVKEYAKPKTASFEYGKRKIKSAERKFFEVGIECTLKYGESDYKRLISDAKKIIQRHYLNHNLPPLEFGVGAFGRMPL